MLFENNEIDINQIPSVENLSYEPLKTQYKKVMYFNWTLFFLILPVLPFLAEIIIEEDINIWWFLVFYALIIIVYITGLVIINLGFPVKGYALREHDIIYRSGYINNRIITVPFNRIQHTEIRQSMIARMLGLSKLKIFTAGGHNSGLYIHGITPETAQQLKDFLSKTVNKYE
jgi:membrane protein YdbS with pleckstrin-like domain